MFTKKFASFLNLIAHRKMKVSDIKEGSIAA